ncbi:hypothetical protein FI667_g8181, partial [Globisporangium splendens]
MLKSPKTSKTALQEGDKNANEQAELPQAPKVFAKIAAMPRAASVAGSKRVSQQEAPSPSMDAMKNVPTKDNTLDAKLARATRSTVQAGTSNAKQGRGKGVVPTSAVKDNENNWIGQKNQA